MTANEYIVKTISAMSEVPSFASNVSHVLCFRGLMKKKFAVVAEPQL